jgi:hypothetical protein
VAGGGRIENRRDRRRQDDARNGIDGSDCVHDSERATHGGLDKLLLAVYVVHRVGRGDMEDELGSVDDWHKLVDTVRQVGLMQRQALSSARQREQERVLVRLGIADSSADSVAGLEQQTHHVLSDKSVGSGHDTNRHFSLCS